MRGISPPTGGLHQQPDRVRIHLCRSWNRYDGHRVITTRMSQQNHPLTFDQMVDGNGSGSSPTDRMNPRSSPGRF
jgi:hypothetical protein